MPAQFPNLKGVATSDLVETIGSGSYKASYINWSRTLQLLRDNAPEWTVEAIFNADGGLVHQAPVGGYLLLRCRHIDGSTGPEVPQAIMDHRNNAIAFDKITARDITDTHRRGSCMCLAYTTGLGGELWAKMPLESGYAVSDDMSSDKQEAAVKPVVKVSKQKAAKATEADFMKACMKKGLLESAAKSLVPRLNGDFDNGIKTIEEKDKLFVEGLNEKFQSSPGEGY